MRIRPKLKKTGFQNPMERAIIIGIGLLVVWLIALMTFMDNEQSHVLNLAFVGVLIALLMILSRVLPKSKYQGYLVAVGATMIAVVGYFRLGSFFIHTEIIFTLAIIGVTVFSMSKQKLLLRFWHLGVSFLHPHLL